MTRMTFQVFSQTQQGVLALDFSFSMKPKESLTFMQKVCFSSSVQMHACRETRTSRLHIVGVSQAFPLALEGAFIAKLKGMQQKAVERPCVVSRSHHTEGIHICGC